MTAVIEHRLEQLAALLRRLIDLGLVAIIVVAPLFMGGRHPLGKLVYLTLVAGCATLWCAQQALSRRREYRWSGAEYILLASASVFVVQLLPLSSTWLRRLSPATLELLPVWSNTAAADLGLTTWRYLSLTPVETRLAAAVFAAHAIFFLLLVQRIATLSDVRRLLNHVAFSAVTLAIIGLVQMLAGNGKFLWVYDDPERTTLGVLRGPFFNQNHMAHFLVLGFGALIAWGAIRAQPRPSWGSARSSDWRSAVCIFALAALLLSLILTRSRGGVLALMTSVAVMSWSHWKHISVRKKPLLIALAVGALVLSASLIYGGRPLGDRWGDAFSANSFADLSAARWQLWQAHAKVMASFPVFGTGIGSHREIYPVYLNGPSAIEFSYGESGYLQVLVDSGMLGFALLLAALSLAFRWATLAMIHAVDSSVRWTGSCVLAGLAASTVHSLVDFVWYIPACLSITLVLAACACRQSQLLRNVAGPPERVAGANGSLRARRWWIAACGLVAAVGALMIQTQLPLARAARHWDQYRRIVLAGPSEVSQRENLSEMIAQLEAYLQHHPGDARVHLRLAKLLLYEFELRQQSAVNAMPLEQIQSAVMASQFDSPRSLDQWLAIAVGEHRDLLYRARRHNQIAIWSSPLQGQGYLPQAKLSFLGGATRDPMPDAVQQALRLRPHHGTVLVEAGRFAARSGDPQAALRHYQQAFLQDRYKPAVIEALANEVPPEILLRQFDLNLFGLARLYTHYRVARENDKARHVAAAYLERLQQEEPQGDGARLIEYRRQVKELASFLARQEVVDGNAEREHDIHANASNPAVGFE